MSDEKEDLRVEPVPGSPVSLRKFIEAGKLEDKKFTIMVDGTPERAGVRADDPHTVNVMITDREEQAQYFLGLGLPMPAYLRKYLAIIYKEGMDLDAMYAQASMNRGLRQMIGLIQIMAGALNMARKAGKGVRFYVELPETYMHPAEVVNITDAMNQILNDYGPEPPKQEAAVA